MFSFVKELNDETKDLLQSLNDRQNTWRWSPGVVVWAFWIGGDTAKAQSWVARHELNNIVFGVVSPNDPALAAWKLHPMATNSHVLACQSKRAMITLTDLTVDDLNNLEAKLFELVKPRD